jgi:16S rRNA (adenine1518-N6/adenine1519-N6)-dimethyltransferase
MAGQIQRLSHHRKRLGQVFLRDPLITEHILESAALTPHDTVLEIGPGRGALTEALAQHSKTLYAIEIDPTYVDTLRQRFAQTTHVHIIHADARTYDYGQLPMPLVVVANLPYSMGMPILRQLFSFRHRLARLIIMLQHEVAARLLATPSTSAYGALSVFFQYYATIRHCFEVSRHAFSPIPAVDSTVLALVPYSTPPWECCDEPFFLQVVRSAFVHRRKTLRANLLTAPELHLTKATLETVFTTLNLPSMIRPQDISVARFVQLAACLHALITGREASSRGEL